MPVANPLHEYAISVMPTLGRRELNAWFAASTGERIRQIITGDEYPTWTVDQGLALCDVEWSVARELVRTHHRHNAPPPGWKFGAGLTSGQARQTPAEVLRLVALSVLIALLMLEVSPACPLGSCTDGIFSWLAWSWLAWSCGSVYCCAGATIGSIRTNEREARMPGRIMATKSTSPGEKPGLPLIIPALEDAGNRMATRDDVRVKSNKGGKGEVPVDRHTHSKRDVLFRGKRPFTDLSRTIEQDSLSFVQGCSNCFQSALQIAQVLEDRGAILSVHHGSQKIALTHELLVVVDQDLERGRLLTKALGHTIIFRSGLLLNQGFQSANSSG
jgi:hypothetical protein